MDKSTIIKNPLFVMIPGQPRKRTEGEPFLTLDSSSQKLTQIAPYIERISTFIESTMTRKLLPITLSFTPLPNQLVAVYDVGDGKFMLNSKWMSYLDQVPMEWIIYTYDVILSSLEKFTFAPGFSITDPVSSSDLANKLFSDLPSILHESVWLCISCIIVLSIGLPLLANYVFIEIAVWACQQYHWDEDTCGDAVAVAITLAYALLPLFAYVIYVVCNLTQCSSNLLAITKVTRRFL